MHFQARGYTYNCLSVTVSVSTMVKSSPRHHDNSIFPKYTEDNKYTHGPDKYKHRPNKKAKGHGTNLSKKSEHQRRMPSIPETEESLDESLSENGQASTKKKRKKKTSGARRKTAQAASFER